MLANTGPSRPDSPILSELQAMIEELKAAYADYAAKQRNKSYLSISDAAFTKFIGVTRPAFSQQMSGYNKPSLESLLKFFVAFRRLYPGVEGDEKAHKYLELLDREEYIDLCEAYYNIWRSARFQFLLKYWSELDEDTQEDIVNVVRGKFPPGGE